MRVRLLGSVELFDRGGAAVPIAAPKRRAVLAVLALELNRLVPVDRLLDLVWDGAPPPRAKTALQGHVSALRRLLGPGLTLATRDPGYTLLGSPADVDLHAFQQLCERAAASDDDADAAEQLGRALELWRGVPLADLPGTALREGVGTRLSRSRLSALEAWAERKLRLAQGADTLTALEQAVREDPFREPLVRLLLLGLHQADRQTDAIALFHRTKELLGTELGLDPGPPLRAAFASVLRSEPVLRPAPPRPAPPSQLPSEGGGFVGRAAELDRLDLACATGGSKGPGIALVVGPAGVGKTALALRWAHRRGPDFPDGRLFADLRGFSAAPGASTASVLTGFLRALGAPDSAVPAGLDEGVALYRSLLAERRVLVVLDNVRAVADVLPLLPSGPGCAVVVTSRNLLGGLVARQGAVVLRVEALPPDESRDLLAGTVGGDRVAAEAEAALALVRLCDGLPLALRVAGARLATHPHWTVSDLVEDLSDEHARLASLSTDDDAEFGVEAALRLSYQALPAPAAELFRLLGLHPGPDLDRWAAAALLGAPPAEARRALAALASAHLVQETAPGRFARHDLVRLYTVQLAGRGLTATERDAAHGRLLEYYLAATAAAAEPVSSQKQLLYRSATYARSWLPAVAGGADASAAWFTGEATAVRALVALFAEGPRAAQAWRLACNTMPLYFGTGHVDDWVAASLSGLRAAESSGELVGRSRMHADVGMALGERGEHREAMRYLERAVGLARESGSRETHYLSLFRLAIGQLEQGEFEQARETMEFGLAEARDMGDVPAQAQTLNNLGHVLNQLGRHQAGLDCAERARDLTADTPSAHTHLASLATAAEALQALGRREEAIASAREAVRLARAYGNPAYEAQALHLIGQFQQVLGRPAEAVESLRRSLDILTPLGRPEAEAIHALLAAEAGGAGQAASGAAVGAAPEPEPSAS